MRCRLCRQMWRINVRNKVVQRKCVGGFIRARLCRYMWGISKIQAVKVNVRGFMKRGIGCVSKCARIGCVDICGG